MGPVKPVLIAEEDEQHSHGHKVDYLQHIKGSNTGHIFTWFSSSLFVSVVNRQPVSSICMVQLFKNEGKKKNGDIL